MKKKITKKEFIEQYSKNSKMTVEEILKLRKAIPCDCGDKICKGWQMVRALKPQREFNTSYFERN